jgi:hypothetical protein
MSGGPSEPSGRDGPELRCIFIPDGYQGPRPDYAFGHDTLELRCSFIRDEYDGPRPGYPWIEFGRMTLDPAPAAGASKRTASETSSAAVATADQAGTAAGPTMAPLPASSGSGEFGGRRRMPPVGQLGDNGSPDITATMALWNALSDPRAILAAADPRTILAGLDSLNTTGPANTTPAN